MTRRTSTSTTTPLGVKPAVAENGATRAATGLLAEVVEYGLVEQPLEAWLEKHAKTRLAPEAADLLMRRLLKAGARDQKRMERALTWVNDTRPEDLLITPVVDIE